jgi:hypothetical protein
VIEELEIHFLITLFAVVLNDLLQSRLFLYVGFVAFRACESVYDAFEFGKLEPLGCHNAAPCKVIHVKQFIFYDDFYIAFALWTRTK